MLIKLSASLKPLCPGDEFHCGSGGCINQTLVCNKEPDCDDKSDERHCSELSPFLFMAPAPSSRRRGINRNFNNCS